MQTPDGFFEPRPRYWGLSGLLDRCEFLGATAIFSSDAMRRLLAMVQKVAAAKATVLITGESGTGKEVIARALHHYSPRSAESWVDVNCAALPESLLESELFGHEKGAFSSADSAKPGLFEMADRGTLFLDEIGELDARLQVKLLRVLDGASFYRVGGVKKVSVDVRLVAATNRDLKAAARQGRFRADLYHRLSQIQLSIPPLRDRPDDILPLAHHFLAEQRPGLRFSGEAARRLRCYNWPGNVRELKNVAVRAAVLAAGSEITPADLPDEFSKDEFSADLRQSALLQEIEKSAIFQALRENGGHQERAAAHLGISRRTLQRRIKSYQMAGAPAAPVGV
ncbi:MAG TPA: sigma-54 dependent transcriptional regulator [Bryobacteraceae bacterium]|nr:sigma-54 dependent transcriptional regulator [Bryobacteraceae bacterium]